MLRDDFNRIDRQDNEMTTPQPTTPPRKRRWYQFSLRTLMIVMLLASVGMSWFAVRMKKANEQKRAFLQAELADLRSRKVALDAESATILKRIAGCRADSESGITASMVVHGGSVNTKIVFIERRIAEAEAKLRRLQWDVWSNPAPTATR